MATHWVDVPNEPLAAVQAEIDRDCHGSFIIERVDLRRGTASMTDGCNHMGAMRDWLGRWSITSSTMLACMPITKRPPGIYPGSSAH